MSVTSYTAADIVAFERNLVTRNGVIQTSFADQTTTFATYADAMAFLAEMRRLVAAAAGTGGTRYAATSKGV